MNRTTIKTVSMYMAAAVFLLCAVLPGFAQQVEQVDPAKKEAPQLNILPPAYEEQMMRLAEVRAAGLSMVRAYQRQGQNQQDVCN